MSDGDVPAEVLEWLPSLLNTSSDFSVIFARPDGTITAWLGASERLLGYSVGEAVGMNMGRFFTPEDRALGLDKQEHALALATGRSEDDRWHVRKNGTRFWATGVLLAVRGPDGSAVALCKILRDKTDIRTHIEALQNQIAAIEAERVRRTNFLISLGHELANTITPMLHATTLLGKSEPRAGEQGLTVLRRQLALMGKLLKDLNEAARATLGQTRIETKEVDVQQAITAAVEGYASVAARNRQALQVVLPPAPITIEADPVRLDQMLANLLSNATKYTPEGGHIVVSASVEAEMAVIRIEDDGRGIAPDLLPRIFDLFTRADADQGPPGLGVGLGVVRQLAKAHGGFIEARSPGFGLGSVFTLRLPLNQPPRMEG